jgi:hypothetical protein
MDVGYARIDYLGLLARIAILAVVVAGLVAVAGQSRS